MNAEKEKKLERLESQQEQLREKAELVDSLRQDAVFVEEERLELHKRHLETMSRLQRLTEDHETLAARLSTSEASAKEHRDQRMAFEAKALDFEEEARDLKVRLTVSETAWSSLEEKVQAGELVVRSLRDELTAALRALDRAKRSHAKLEETLESQEALCEVLKKTNGGWVREIEALQAPKAALRSMQMRLREPDRK